MDPFSEYHVSITKNTDTEEFYKNALIKLFFEL